MFHLALSLGLEDQPLQALEHIAGFVEETGRRHGVADPLQMTVAATDGERLYAARYATGAVVNSLYVTADASAVRDLYQTTRDSVGFPTMRGRSSPSPRRPPRPLAGGTGGQLPSGPARGGRPAPVYATIAVQLNSPDAAVRYLSANRPSRDPLG